MTKSGVEKFGITTEQPVMNCHWIENFPPAQEDMRLVKGINWSEIKSWLRIHKAAQIVVSPSDVGLLIDAIQNRIGFNVMIRITEPGVVWLCDPESLTESFPQDGDTNDEQS